MVLLVFLLFTGCDGQPQAAVQTVPAPTPEQLKAQAEEREANQVAADAKITGYAFKVCAEVARTEAKVVFSYEGPGRSATEAEFIRTADGFCRQFDGLKPGEPGTYSLKPLDNSLVRGIAVCAPRVAYVEDDPEPNPCFPIAKTDRNGNYVFVVYPRIADEPVIEIGTIRPGIPLMRPVPQ